MRAQKGRKKRPRAPSIMTRGAKKGESCFSVFWPFLAFLGGVQKQRFFGFFRFFGNFPVFSQKSSFLGFFQKILKNSGENYFFIRKK